MNEVLFRAATVQDAEAIVSFQLAMALETENLKLDPKICAQGVTAVFEDSRKGRYFVVESEQKVVGALLNTYEWSDWRNGQVWWIHSLYLIPALRGKRVFSEFYAFIRTQAVAEGVRGIRLYVDKTNQRARAIYNRLGMSAEHYELFEKLF